LQIDCPYLRRIVCLPLIGYVKSSQDDITL
jgi:hypothetical protein